MKILKYFLIIGLSLATLQNLFAYPYSYEKIEFYNDPAEACCVPNHFMGFYLGANAGHGWLKFFLHRPQEENLAPLHRADWQLKEWIPVGIVGYDFFPRRKIPLRIEANVTYVDTRFTINPLFDREFDQGEFSKDAFRFYNSMATIYFDLHSCSRFVPFIGLSGGYVIIKTDHRRLIVNTPPGRVTSDTSHTFSRGGTIGSRFFITNHFIANLQFRFDDLQDLQFKNKEDITLPGKKDYSSDFFHEASVLFGLAYEF